MAFRCDNCGKKKIHTSSQKHKKGVAGGKWKHRAPKTLKVNIPNLHVFNGYLDGAKGKWRLCTKCLRRAKAAQLELLKELESKKAAKKPAKEEKAKKSSKVTKKSSQ